MGEAKRRGTYEQRKALAIARENAKPKRKYTRRYPDESYLAMASALSLYSQTALFESLLYHRRPNS